MPPKQSSTNQSSSSNIQPKDKSQNQFFRDNGFKSHYDFNLSYGVKPGDHEGHEEMKEVVKTMRDHEQRVWEAEKGKK